MRANRLGKAARLGAALAVLLCCAGTTAAEAGGKGAGTLAAPSVSFASSPYRYVALHPRLHGAPTVIARIERHGGRVDRWWFVRGHYFIPAVAYDNTPGGLSANGRTLLLTCFQFGYPPRETTFAVLDTKLYLRHPYRPGEKRPKLALARIHLPGFFSFDAISPDGSTAYLVHYRGNWAGRNYEVRALDLDTGRLLPDPIVDPRRPDARMEGVPITRVSSADGRWAYTLYDGEGRRPFLHALDTVQGRARIVDLPQLRHRRNRFLLNMRLTAGGRKLVLTTESAVQGRPESGPLFSIDTRSFAVTPPPRSRPIHPVAAFHSVLEWLRGLDASRFLAFTETPRLPGNLLERVGVIGHSSQGRPIELDQLGDPAIERRVLVFGCVHGDECAGSGIEPVAWGCPDPYANIYLVRTLDPDGAAAGTRLNGRGVDLNRNFPSRWGRRGNRWDPEYSGPRPFSEPESRLAARTIRALQPQATIWLHQHHGLRPFVRAWGQSAPAARRFARLAGMPFRPMRWQAGTAPNWQNHRFPGTSSFVVELPWGRLDPQLKMRLGAAVDKFARREAGLAGLARFDAKVSED